jgi:hypothetical protein
MRLIYPVLAQIFWTFIVIVLAGRIRLASLRAREVTIGAVALGNNAWPDRVKAYGNNMNNQFETPVLFFVLTGIAIFIGATGWGMTALAWGFVASRVIHTLIHTGGNNVPRRFQAFVAGVFILMAMWGGIVLKLAGIG